MAAAAASIEGSPMPRAQCVISLCCLYLDETIKSQSTGLLGLSLALVHLGRVLLQLQLEFWVCIQYLSQVRVVLRINYSNFL